MEKEVFYERKYGRNEPCPCGSGKKYKKCCKSSHESLLAEVQVLDDLANSVPDLIAANRFDEAEQVCHRILKDYPDQPDGLYRLADVYFATGKYKEAADYYHQTVVFCEDFNQEHPGAFDLQLIQEFKEQVQQSLSFATS